MKRFIVLLILSSSLNGCPTFVGPSSKNIIIRWAFQALCDHTYDPRTVWPSEVDDDQLDDYEDGDEYPHATFDVRNVKAGDMIFVRDIKSFMQEKYRKIKVPFFILTHGEYLDRFKKKFFKYLDDDKILAWFTIHPCDVEHERVIPIPLGIVQYEYHYENKKNSYDKFMKLREVPKTKLLFMNFTEWRMPFRTKIKKFFKKKPFVTHQERCSFAEYMTELSQHKFVLSPPGLGPDLYRVYETVLSGSIPVVKHSHMDVMYEGLPVLFVYEWDEVTEEFLHNKYDEMMAKTYNQERLFMEYWIEFINTKRAEFWPRKEKGTSSRWFNWR